MTNIVEYSKSNASLEEKEKFVFEVIDILDKESYKLFGEIIDLSDESFYKVEEISKRIIELYKVYIKVKEAYDYLDMIEQGRVIYATKRFQLKALLTAFTTMFAFLNNAFLGIVSFVALNKVAINDYTREIGEIGISYSNFDDNRLELIKTTIENCDRLFAGKVSRMTEILQSTHSEEDEGYKAIIVNGFIELYLNGEITDDRLLSISDKYKEKLKQILKKDLNSDSDDLITLIQEFNKHNDECKKMTKKLGTS